MADTYCSTVQRGACPRRRYGRLARARLLSAPLALREKVMTSGRRWERHGLWRTIVHMWRLRLAFYFGADPAMLARRYDNTR